MPSSVLRGHLALTRGAQAYMQPKHPYTQNNRIFFFFLKKRKENNHYGLFLQECSIARLIQ